MEKEILTVGKVKFWQFGKGNFDSMEKGNFDSLEKEKFGSFHGAVNFVGDTQFGYHWENSLKLRYYYHNYIHVSLGIKALYQTLIHTLSWILW